MENTHDDGDDHFSITSGDLGLGESTRSGSYLNFELLNIGHSHNSLSVSDSCLLTHFRGHICSSGLQNNNLISDNDANLIGKKSLCDQSCKRLLKQDTSQKINKCSIGVGDSKTDVEVFPTYADVPYGTSLRQQKKLFEQQNNSLRQQFAASLTEDATEDGFKKRNWNSWRNNTLKLTVKEIEAKLIKAVQEMEELKIELDACQKRLDAKYQAVAILKQQADLADTELKNTEKMANETRKCLEQELSKLQFELEWRESSFMNSQQTWAERFDRVCQENAILMSKLESRNEELRRANAHKSAISRERDELLALLDITERLKYEQGKSRVAEEEYSTFTSSELAVLGACKCRVSSPDPCGCAHAAANLRKEVAKLKEELELSQKRREESNLTVDAYRSAFEEQLTKSRNMSIRLSQIATLSSRTAKAKAAIKWLIQVLNDDDYVPPKPIEQGMDAEKGNNLSNMSLQEMITVLTDMVHEKNEALAHQKLAAQVLTNKLYMYEKREGRQSELIGTSTDPRPHRLKKKQSKEAQILQDNSNSEHSDSKSGEKCSDFDEGASGDRVSSFNKALKYVIFPCKEEVPSNALNLACTNNVSNKVSDEKVNVSNFISERDLIDEVVTESLNKSVGSIECEVGQHSTNSVNSFTMNTTLEEIKRDHIIVEKNPLELNGCHESHKEVNEFILSKNYSTVDLDGTVNLIKS